MRHVPSAAGAYAPCPTCYGTVRLTDELKRRHFPTVWAHLDPAVVVERFGQGTPAGRTLHRLLSRQYTRVHIYGLPHDTRSAFIGTLVHGWLTAGRGVQVLDSGDLSRQHFDKDRSRWTELQAHHDAVVFNFGREVEPTIGQFYFRYLLDRSIEHALPFVLVTDFPLHVHVPRYNNLDAVIQAAAFDATDIALQPL